MILLLLALAVPNLHTPGAIRPLSQAQVCTIKWGADRRHVTEAMKRQVAAAYGLQRSQIVAKGKGPCCEIDHKIPRELGGADDVRNLWPQPWIEAAQKDQQENAAHKAVCAGQMSLAAAQATFRRWGQ